MLTVYVDGGEWMYRWLSKFPGGGSESGDESFTISEFNGFEDDLLSKWVNPQRMKTVSASGRGL